MSSVRSGLSFVCALFCLEAAVAQTVESVTMPDHPASSDPFESAISSETAFDAIEQLRDLIHTTDAPRDKALASLALASAHIDKEPRVALQYLAQLSLASPVNGDLSRFVDYYRALVLHRLGSYEESTQLTSELLKSAPSELWQKRLFELQIEGQFQQGAFGKVIETYRQYASKLAMRKREETHVRLAAEAYGKLGDAKQYLDALESLAEGYPASAASRWAFEQLLQMRAEPKSPYVFDLDLLKKMSRNAVLETGLAEFLVSSLASPIRDGSSRPKLLSREQQVAELMDMRLYPEALRLSRSLLEEARAERDTALHAFSLVHAATILNRIGEAKEAVRLYSEFLATYPKHHYVFRARHGLADALSAAGLYRESAHQYEKLAGISKNQDYRWKHFWNTYMAGDDADALQILSRKGYVSSRDNDDEADTRFWKAQLLRKLGKESAADELVNKILTSEAQSYYASVVLQNEPSLISSKTEQSDGSRINAAAVRTVALEVEADEPVEPSKPRYNMAELQLVDDLSRFGLMELAAMELRGLPWSTLNRENSFNALSRLSAVLGEYRHSNRVRSLPKSALRNVPRNWWELVEHQRIYRGEWEVYYPLAFADVVERNAEEFDVDKLLILSVMRAESRYNVDARSWVGARGLMQIMPYTGARIAKLLGDHDFEVDQLSDPQVNVRFSAFYIRKLLNYYQSNPVLAVAAYNAGPIAVDRWLGQCASCEVAEFVEFIPYKETRRYVKKVMANLVHYERIYHGRKNVNFIRALPQQLGADKDLF